jgi:flagellar protein FlaG
MLNVTQTTIKALESGYSTSNELRSSKPVANPDLIPADPTKATDLRLAKEAIASKVEELNRFVRARNAQIQFVIDETSARVITKIVDINTSEVLRQIPSEEVLRMSEALSESLGGTNSAMQLVQTRA